MAKIWNIEEKAEIVGAGAISDPLSEVTRRERRLLLIVSLVLLAVTFGGLLPTEVEALGIRLSAKDAARLLLLGCAIQTYLLVGFWLYSTSDLKAWAMERDRTLRDGSRVQAAIHTNLGPGPGDDDEAFEEWLHQKRSQLAELFRAELNAHFRVLSWRAVFERWLPVLVGLGALIAAVCSVAQGNRM